MTDGTSLCDEQASAAGVCAYAVFATEGDAWSAPATTSAVVLLREPDQLSVRAGNGVVVGTWAVTPAAARVRVVRRDKGFIRGMLSAVEIAAGQTGFEDRSVVNGKFYDYKISVVYDTPGRPTETAGQTLRVKPTAGGGWVLLLVFVFVALLVLLATLSEGAEPPTSRVMPAAHALAAVGRPAVPGGGR